MHPNPLKVLVFGAGGIGSFIGALLSRSGHEVTLICRGAQLAAIRHGGLRVRQGGTEWVADRLQATEHIGDYGTADVVLHCVKLYGLERSSVTLRPCIGDHTMVIPIQNGVIAHMMLARALPAGSIVPGTVFMSSHVIAPGVVELQSESTQFTFGELSGELTARVRRFHEAGLSAGYESKLSASITTELWRKFVVLNAVAPLCLLSRQPVGVLREDPIFRGLMMQSIREVMAVAAAHGVQLDDALAREALDLTDRRDHGAKVSMLEDLEAGKPLELEWICGYVSREGSRHGIPTPIADMAYACTRLLAQKAGAPPE